jgi:hypothetical protein
MRQNKNKMIHFCIWFPPSLLNSAVAPPSILEPWRAGRSSISGIGSRSDGRAGTGTKRPTQVACQGVPFWSKSTNRQIRGIRHAAKRMNHQAQTQSDPLHYRSTLE